MPGSIAFKKKCPACSIPWEYEVGGRIYTKLITIVENGKVENYACPNCGTHWKESE